MTEALESELIELPITPTRIAIRTTDPVFWKAIAEAYDRGETTPVMGKSFRVESWTVRGHEVTFILIETLPDATTPPAPSAPRRYGMIPRKLDIE